MIHGLGDPDNTTGDHRVGAAVRRERALTQGLDVITGTPGGWAKREAVVGHGTGKDVGAVCAMGGGVGARGGSGGIGAACGMGGDTGTMRGAGGDTRAACGGTGGGTRAVRGGTGGGAKVVRGMPRVSEVPATKEG
jgi:hypothetical protein